MLASHECGSVSINSSSSSSSASSTTSKPTSGLHPKKDPASKFTGDGKTIRITPRDQSDSYSLSSVDVMDSNDLKYMDDSASSSSTSSISGGVDLGSSSASTASTSPATAQSSRSQDTLKFDTRSPLACPLSNGPLGPPKLNSTSSHHGPTPLVDGKQANTSRCSVPVYRPIQLPKPSRIPVLTSLGRIKPVDARNVSESHTQPRSSGNNGHVHGDHSPTTSPVNSSPRTPVRKYDFDCNGLSPPESVVGVELTNSQKHPHSPSDHIVTGSPLPNGDVPRLFFDGPSPERSPATPRSVNNRNEQSGGHSKATTNGFRSSAEFDDDHRLRELLAMVSDSESDTESIAESIYHQPPKAADRSAASRLAKRLFHLDGFRITDVAKHLCKRNDFSQLVGEEFASLFDFANQRLDTALRTFLNTFSLTGESQERERILLHFSRRYYNCNPDAYPNEEVCHTLVCALMLLNTDLHNQGVTRKMSCQEFINNLSQMHCGDCFSRDELKTLYNAIKQEPLRWPHADPAMMGFVNLYYPGPPGTFGPPGTTPSGILAPAGFYQHPHHPNAPMVLGAQPGPATPFGTYPTMLQPSYATTPFVGGQPITGLSVPGAVPASPAMLNSSQFAYTSPLYWNTPVSASMINPLNSTVMSIGPITGAGTDTSGAPKSSVVTGTNPFIDLMAETNAREYMRGLLVRKWVMESHGKKTSLGRRGWKVYYARLRDLVLYLYKNAMVANAAARAEELHNLHQQQLQQHQNYMRQLAIQQQQQQQQLAVFHAPNQSNHVDDDETAESEQQGQANPVTTEPVIDGVGEEKAECDTTHVTRSLVTIATNESVQSIAGDTYQPVVSLTHEETEQRDIRNGSLDKFHTDDVSADIEHVPHPKSDKLNSAATSSESEVTSSHLQSSVSDLGITAVSNSTPMTGTNSTQSYAMEPPSIVSSVPTPPMAFAPAASAALAFSPPSFVPPVIPPPEAVIRIAHAIASRATDYLKKPNVFRLKTRDGAEYLFEVADAKELDIWVERINFVAALLSAPSIPGPIGSERGFYRPHLPVTCTKLNMREQLEEHQRRLIELGRELSELHKRLPIMSGSKTLKPTRASSISGRTSEAARAAAAAVLARTLNKESNSGKKDAAASDATSTKSSTEIEARPKEQTDEIAEESSTAVDTTSAPVATTTTTTAAVTTSSSSSVSLISVFSTSSLGRRRKASSGSLCGTADTTLGPVLTAKQRAEHEERIQFTESEIHRYKTYARLLEAELFRIQQSSAAVAHAAALAAANNFSPYMNPYGPLPGSLHGFQPYGAIGIGSNTVMPFPTPVPTHSRYLLPRDNSVSAYSTTPNMLPLAVLGPSDPLAEESTNADLASDPVSTASSSVTTTGGMGNPHLPPMYSIPTAVPVPSRPRTLPYSYYGPQLAPPSPYSPSVSGRFYSQPRQMRNPHHFRQQQQSHGLGTPAAGGFGRSNGMMMMMMNGHRLAEEDSTSESPPSSSTESSTAPMEGEPSSTLTGPTTGNIDKFKMSIQSSQSLCSTEGMFYEIV